MSAQPHHPEEIFMERALELARRGQGHVSPNPMVGCVIVHDGKIIGEGYHKQYGGPHAEVNAVNSVSDKSLLAEATAYVNLEPCAHFGKTPPCADMLVREKIKRVVIGNVDPNPLVAGAGIKKLRSAGIDVATGVLEAAGRELNKRFFTFIEKQRPYFILKWAETSDGFMAQEDLNSKWISNALSRQLLHKWRTEEDAVLVGTRTAALDNPQLNVRHWTGRDPARVVIDRNLRLDPALCLFDGSQRTLCYNLIRSEERHNISFIRLAAENFITDIGADLCRRKIQSVIIEGGPQTLQLFIDAKLWDEARVFVSPKTFSRGLHAPLIRGNLMAEQHLEDDLLRYLYPGGQA